jgi:hypothetical protein
VSEQKDPPQIRGEARMKKLISVTLLSAVAMLAAPKATPRAQNTPAPATSTVKKVHKKHHVTKAKTVKPAASTPTK